jgi:DNA polymerase-3 subunit alpha
MTRFLEPAQLHNHSKYSLLDAVPSPEEWVGWCLESGTPALAITDHGTAISMFDALRTKEFIAKYNKKNNTNHALDAVTLVPAVELYVKLNVEDKSHYHITAWAASTEGYHNLMKLASVAYNDTVSYYGSIKGRVTFEQIKQYKTGIKFGTGCIAGPIGKAFWNGDKVKAEELFVMYKELFGDELYIEFHCNDVTHNFNKTTGGFDPIEGDECSCDGNKQKGYNLFLRDMVDKYGGKCIPVTDAHFIMPEDKIIQDCLLKNGNSNGWYFYESYHQLRSEEMFSKLRVHLGEWLTEDRFRGWIENTYEVSEAAKSISVRFEYHLPKISIPDNIQAKVSDYDEQTYYYMMQLIKEHGRWNPDPVYVARFKQELDVIKNNEKLNFIPYFLVYEDIGKFARSKGILQNIARGSAGGSLISFYLKIIHVDPIKAHLPFERFLSHARIRAGSFPDIDADIGDRARGMIMQYLKDKYGAGFAQISTFNKMKTKNAIKDAMFALYGRNRNDAEIKAICDSIPDSQQGIDEHDFLYGFTDQEGNYNAGQVEINKTLANFFSTYPEVEDMVKKLIGTIRGWSRHASAFVISTLDLSAERVPTLIMQDKDLGDITVTQYDASMVEKCGLVKADILGIKTLTATSDCIDLVLKATGVNYLEEEMGVPYIYRLPEDPDVYADFYKKDTDSSFQFNTELIKGHIQEFCPAKRADLSAMTALCRPGALDAPLYDTTAAQYYMDIRNGKREIEYLHEDLKDILSASNGVFVYQEEVMRFLVEIAGYSWEESDIIRSAIAKKKHDVIMASFDKIRTSCRSRGWTEDAIETVCQQIQAFSRYSFNKSHSHAYGELGYITMYLKHHHPLEWWASILNLSLEEDKMRKYISNLGDIVKPPSLAHPTSRFEVREIAGRRHIVTPLSAIKGVGPACVAELTSKGPFASLQDFIDRVNHGRVNSGVISSLIKGRAADDLMDWSGSSDYSDIRRKFIADYTSLRGGKAKLQEDIHDTSALSVFLMEKQYNQAFNKNLLSAPDVLDTLLPKWPALRKTGRSGVPFYMGAVPVLANIKVAEGMIKKSKDKEFGMILLYEKSEFKRGVSKKGKQWSRVSIHLSDGYTTMECTDWDRKGALGWPKNSIVYVKGELKEGWKTPVSMVISEIERLD